MLRILKFQRYILCLLLGATVFSGCDTEIIFEPKFGIPTFTDGIKNQQELEVDCGTESCGPCFGEFEPAPCAADLQPERMKLGQTTYTVENVNRYSSNSQGEVMLTADIKQNGYARGKLTITLASFYSIKTSTVYTLSQTEASLEYAQYSQNGVILSKSSQGKLYGEVNQEKLVISFCDVALNNSVNFSNTNFATGQLTVNMF